MPRRSRVTFSNELVAHGEARVFSLYFTMLYNKQIR